VRLSTGAALTLTGGSLAGNIDTRDGELASLRGDLNSLASTLISQVNSVHAGGYNLNGGTGANFFTGTGASDIAVNSALVNNPNLVQAGGAAGAVGDNQVALALAQLANQPIASLSNQTFSQKYNQTVAGLGQTLASVNDRVDNQTAVQTMLTNQRNSVSGVSLDEEMTNMITYQKAYEASARIINTVAQMLDTILAMKQ
jgi:flagellar hook-associated protein 1